MIEDTQSHTPGPNKLPKRYLQFQKRYPQVFQAYDALGAATAEAGPLSGKTRALVKLAIAAGARWRVPCIATRGVPSKRGAHPRNLPCGFAGTTTLGFPTMMKTFSWMDDVLKE